MFLRGTMEHSSGQSALSRGRKLHSYSELPGRRSPSCMVSQKVIVVWFVLFTTHAALQVLAATRNETYVLEDESSVNSTVWDKTEYRDKLKCKGFHDFRYPEKFFYWPEDNPLFQYCCTNGTDPPAFRYSEHGGSLAYAKYRDVGYFDQCLPFWKCRKKYRDIRYTSIYYTYCEKTDLEKLYWERFWKLILWKYSLQQTILLWFPILEVGVFLLAVAIFPLTWRIANVNLAKTFEWKDLVPTGKIWLRSIWRRLLMDWGHMSLLVMVGNGLFEAMRRQNVYSMQTRLFFAYSMFYLVLFVILSCTSVVQQLAYWIGSATEPKVRKHMNKISQSPVDKEADDVIPEHSQADCARDNRHVRHKKVSFATSDGKKPLYGHDGIELAEVGSSDHGYYASEDMLESQAVDELCMLEGARCDDTIIPTQSDSLGGLKRSISKTMSGLTIKGSSSKHLTVEAFKLGDDYKWQPIATQATIVFALGSLLTTPVDNDEDGSDLFGILLGFFVQAGCLWSGIYSVVVFFQRAAYICRFLMKLRNPNDLQSGNRNETRFVELPHNMIHVPCRFEARAS